MGHRGRQAPAGGTFLFPEHGEDFAVSLTALGSLCSFSECSQGKETADKGEAQMDDPNWQSCEGTSAMGLFA